MSNEEPTEGPLGSRDAPSVDAQLAGRVISLIDLTDLNNEHADDGLDALVRDAVRHSTAAVCVWPEFVARASESIREQSSSEARPLVATVVNFPGGDDTVGSVVAETRQALADGAHEIDLVLPYRAVLDGDTRRAGDMVAAVSDVVHGIDGRHLKVILETGELGDVDMIRRAARCAVDGGADFIKTSTGKTSTSATLASVDSMIDVIEQYDRTIGLKPSGGIRTVSDAARYLDLVDRRLGPQWTTAATFRFGASGLLADAVAAAS